MQLLTYPDMLGVLQLLQEFRSGRSDVEVSCDLQILTTSARSHSLLTHACNPATNNNGKEKLQKHV